MVGAALVAAGFLAYAAFDVAASRLLERRLARAIASSPAVGGRVGSVDVCLACTSYRIRDLSLHSLHPDDAAEGSRLLVAPEIDVGLVPRSLLHGRPLGGITLRDAELHLAVGRVEQGKGTALDVPWKEIGSSLLPMPVDRVDVRGGVLVVRHPGFAEPILWRFRDVRVSARHLSRAGGRAALHATGKTPGDGRFELRVELAPDAAGRFTLVGDLRDVPLEALRGYVEQVMGLGVEKGRLGAHFDIAGTRQGWSGHAECRIDGLDVFDPSDLAEGPAHALWDAVAGAVSSAATLGGEKPLRVRLELGQRFGRPEVDAWTALARLLRAALLAPFARPLEALRSAVVASGGGDGGD